MVAKTLTPTQTELENQFLRDIRLAAIDGGVAVVPPTSPGSEWWLLGKASANLAMQAVTNVRIADDAQNILTAEGEDLDDLRESEGLPELPDAGATGKVVPEILGPTTIRDGQRLISDAGLQYRVVGDFPGISNGSEIDVESIDTGTATNLAGGETLRFTPTPVNVGESATVSRSSPLTGGTDPETDPRKRARILNVRRNRPAGGNWAFIRQLVLDNEAGVSDCYVYPALGGPASAKVVPVKDFDPDFRDYSRTASSALLQRVRQLIWANVPIPEKIVVQASLDRTIDQTLRITIPDSALSGGNGLGWTDAVPWPQLETADAQSVAVSAVGSNYDSITVDAETAVSPVAGQTNIAWWCYQDQRFYTALVTAVSGSVGAWVLTLDRPLTSSEGEPIAAADYISPAARNLNGYGATWTNYFRRLGPGENTADSGRLPRAKRHPYVTDEDPSSLTGVMFGAFKEAHPEITDISFGLASTYSPSVPGSADSPPEILVPRRFAVYLK